MVVEELASVIGVGEQFENRVDDRVTGDLDAGVEDPFGTQIGSCRLGRRQTEVGHVIGDDAVVLFGHAAIEAPEPGLDVNEGDLHRVGAQRSGGDGVGVALHHNRRRLDLAEELLEAGDGLGDLTGPRLASDRQLMVGIGQPQVVDEVAVQRSVPVLSGVDEPAARTQAADHQRQLYQLGPRAGHERDRSGHQPRRGSR